MVFMAVMGAVESFIRRKAVKMYYAIIKEANKICKRIMKDPKSPHYAFENNVFYAFDGYCRAHWQFIMPRFTKINDNPKKLKLALKRLPTIKFDESSGWFTFRKK